MPANTGAAIRIAAGYGRLYVTGPNMAIAQRLPGAAFNARRRAYEVSLTLETLRALRRECRVDKRTFASFCTPEVLAWANAANVSQQRVVEVHRRIAAGERQQLPWLDRRAGLEAPDTAQEHEVEYENGVRRYKYRPPYAHQQLMASVACWLDGTGFIAAVGTGKTRAAYAAAQQMYETGQIDVLVVLTKKVLVENVWAKEALIWSDKLHPIVLTGAVEKRRQKVRREALMPAPARAMTNMPVLITNHEVLTAMEGDFLHLCRHKRVGLVIDEAQKLRNADAKVTQSGMRLAMDCVWRIIATGSPVIRGEQDVWSQWYIIDLGIDFGANNVQFRREWLIEDNYTMKVEVRSPEAQTEIGMRMRRRGVRVTQEEGLPDLPPRTYTVTPVELSAEQRRAYRELEEELVTRLYEADERGGVYATAANQLTMILRLTQITSGFIKDEDGAIYRFPTNPKMTSVAEMVEENIRNGSIILWGWYREDVEFMAETLREYLPGVIYGGQSDTLRNRTLNDFEIGRSRLLIANQASGGVGLNLQVAHLAAYFSQNHNYEYRIQSEGRNYRGGSQRHRMITYNDFVAQGTIDEDIRDVLAHRKSTEEAVVDLRRAIGADIQRR